MSSCATCRYFSTTKTGGEVGACRARPPTLVLVGMAQHPVTQRPVPVTNSFWPQVQASEWCGEHAVQLRSVNIPDLAALSA